MSLNHDEIQDDFRELVDGFCTGELMPSERKELEARLRDNVELQTYFLSYMAVHSGLYWGLRDRSSTLSAQQTSISSGLYSSDPTTPTLDVFGFPQSLAVALQGLWRPWIRYGFMAAAAVVLLVGIAAFAIRPTADMDGADRSVAVIPAEESPAAVQPAVTPNVIGRMERLESQVIIERGGAKQKAVVGMELLAKDLLDVPVDGSVELTLMDRLHAKLGPRTTFALASAREAVLRAGFVQVDARQRISDTPYAIGTSDAEAWIQDACLSMGASRKRTQIRVTEGQVMASRRHDGLTVKIPEGYCSTIAQSIDSGPRPSREGAALFVVSGDLYPDKHWARFEQVVGDRIIGDRLWRSAMPVRVRTYDKLQAKDLENCAIIVLSLFQFETGFEQKLRDLKLHGLPVPIVCMEPLAFPALGMTSPVYKEDFGFGRDPMLVDIADPSHPLAAGFSGRKLDLFTYKARPGTGWAKPAASAAKIAHLHNQPDRWMLFAYERGELLAEGTAPARRVGLFLFPTGADYDSPALDLVDAAIDWCLDPAPVEMAGFLHHAAEMAQIGLHATGQSVLVLQ
ncbi:MAG: hypothetical protein IT427_14330 [Pirellulales bacterium]|nr:hypothetical protein [Pirellulales bacterium]